MKGMKKAGTSSSCGASQLITDHIAELGDWRGKFLARLRKIVLDADREIVEEWKWNTPVWTRAGLVCSAGAFKDHVKVNFFGGASLKDPQGMFNAGLDAKKTRAIDFSEGDDIDASALKELVRAAVALNLSRSKER